MDIQTYLERSITYTAYRDMMAHLVENGKTTGPNQTESLVFFTKLNHQRMKRIEKSAQITPELQTALNRLTQNQTWLVLTEAWCGDAAQALPLFHQIDEACEKVTLRLVLRDENLELMDQFLTNGGRSIPKLIILDEATHEVINTWGPRPAEMQEMVNNWKAAGGGNKEEFLEEVQRWYNTDKTATTQQELNNLLTNN